MAEPLDSTPRGARSWTPEQIPPLARRLWLLFWLTAAQALAALLIFFSPTQSFSYRLGELLQAATLLGGGLALLGLSRVLRAYRWAGLCSLAAGAVGGLTLLPLEGDLATGVDQMGVICLPLLLIGAYQEYRGHGQLLEAEAPALAQKWRILWRWTLGCYVGLLASAVLLVLLPVFGWMLAITTSVLQMAVKAFHALCLCRTALFFRRCGGGEGGPAVSRQQHTDSPPALMAGGLSACCKAAGEGVPSFRSRRQR